MKILVYGLNFSPECVGVGKYSGEMVEDLVRLGHEVRVVTAPPYYPAWRVSPGYRRWWYQRDQTNFTPPPVKPKCADADAGTGSSVVGEVGSERWHFWRNFMRSSAQSGPIERETAAIGVEDGGLEHVNGGIMADAAVTTSAAWTTNRSDGHFNQAFMIRCPLWVPKQVNGIKRIFHLASFAAISFPVVLWQAIRFRPDVIFTVEPAAFGMPATLLAATVGGSKSWLHVQDFEVDAAFDLGILKRRRVRRAVLMIEGWLMRGFDRVSTISPRMIEKLSSKGVDSRRIVSFPNWVDCDLMRPLPADEIDRAKFGLPKDKILAVYSGNIGAKQGLEVIVEAAERLWDNASLHFVICGQGACAGRIEGMTKSCANITCLPLQPLDRFNEFLNCADIHLLPQRPGAADLVMPSKLTGMLATGRPIVACADDGTQIAQVVSGRGLVVMPDDLAGFANAIERLSADRALRHDLGGRARAFAIRSLGRDAILRDFVDDLRTLVCPRVLDEQSGAGEHVAETTGRESDSPEVDPTAAKHASV